MTNALELLTIIQRRTQHKEREVDLKGDAACFLSSSLTFVCSCLRAMLYANPVNYFENITRNYY